ncbi:hypothetical protein GbCGDNIH1_7203 [Granulibacter bethesdensis CGDNIH1]|uniref:Uncharacterized protein n=1 Tax=Granulibacter bethesdensis (strain ATCC BAA-1260 / CGDNIH1) TaxID=391165 RepID=A0A286M312_GRABC|nr:hypothetical protein GbCGDNIH5_7203 [Granulibacter bethesdensis]APH64624.1 hypothetical protein GbCGDNIH1I4_7203 [Granulibacter bethesdensis]ASV62411.1 hypothetical protein GbCGDNIH1_7203 [Granulibacter bethesdensis CGDNIH1]
MFRFLSFRQSRVTSLLACAVPVRMLGAVIVLACLWLGILWAVSLP